MLIWLIDLLDFNNRKIIVFKQLQGVINYKKIFNFIFAQDKTLANIMSSDHPPNNNLLNLSISLPRYNKKLQQSPKKSMKIPDGAKKIGNYLLGKTIGSGTFGKVHVGMHMLTGEKVAVKIIQKNKIAGKDIQRVKNQIQILRTTRHRNLVHLYEIIETQKSLLLITEHMPNGQLFNLIMRQKKLSQQQACEIFHQLIDGLQYLHQMGITHRDLKPENIMIDYDNQIKIIDFGLSRSFCKQQKLRSACGSAHYASPQMIEGKNPYDPKSTDIWSCGIILYAMVAGSLPFVQEHTSHLYKKIMSGLYRPLRNVSEQLKNLIEKILITDPTKRLTLKQIKFHSWWSKSFYRKGYGLLRHQKINYDQQIVERTVDLGYNFQKVVQSLQNDQKNKQTGTYYILMKKCAKLGQNPLKYLGNSNFDPQLIQEKFNIIQEESSQTAVQTPQCDILIPRISEGPQSTCTQNIQPSQWWVHIGTKQAQKINEKNNSQYSKQAVNFSSIILPKIKFEISQVNKSSPNRMRKLRIKKEQIKIRKKEFYMDNDFLSNFKTRLNNFKSIQLLSPYQDRKRAGTLKIARQRILSSSSILQSDKCQNLVIQRSQRNRDKKNFFLSVKSPNNYSILKQLNQKSVQKSLINKRQGMKSQGIKFLF